MADENEYVPYGRLLEFLASVLFVGILVAVLSGPYHRSAAAEECMMWKPVSTRPNKFEPVLVFVPGNRVGTLQEEPDTIHIAFWKDEWDGLFNLEDDDHFLVMPTHWMPLPTAPTS